MKHKSLKFLVVLSGGLAVTVFSLSMVMKSENMEIQNTKNEIGSYDIALKGQGQNTKKSKPVAQTKPVLPASQNVEKQEAQGQVQVSASVVPAPVSTLTQVSQPTKADGGDHEINDD